MASQYRVISILILALFVVHANAQVTKDFDCMRGCISNVCTKGETGSGRFFTNSQENVTEYNCKSIKELIEVDPPEPTTGKKIFACLSYFQWLYNDDAEDKITHTFQEEHDCIYDTDQNIKNVLKDNDECIYEAKLKAHEKICVCKGPRDCNQKFASNFPKEPKEAKSLCGVTKIIVEKPDTTDLDTDTHNKRSSSSCIVNILGNTIFQTVILGLENRF